MEWKGYVSFWLSCSWKVPNPKAVATSYLLAGKDHLKVTVTYLRESILTVFQNSKVIPLQPVLLPVSQGRWKLAKHILISTIVQHFFPSTQLTTLSLTAFLNRTALISSSRLWWPRHWKNQACNWCQKFLTGDRNEVFHSEWHYTNKILKNVSWSNVVNSAAGIMFQERKSGVFCKFSWSKLSKHWKKLRSKA